MSDKARWVRRQAAEAVLRKATGLADDRGWHPAPAPFNTQAEALACLQRLLDSGDYTLPQLGLFAKEVCEGGKRQFIVDTFAGFARDHAPAFDHLRAFAELPDTGGGQQEHLYEVILENRPCWLYFDLEYSKENNPGLDPETVMLAFRSTFADFCIDVLGALPDESSMIELESSSPVKFSKHVLVQRLREAPGDPVGRRHLAFANNAQVGLVVSELLAYAHARKSQPESPARFLFLRAPGPEPREACLVDESVYSRNRSFRLLFNSKFGKSATLKLSRDSVLSTFSKSEYPPLQLLRTMASFVPAGTPLFKHPLIPPNYGHSHAKANRILPAQAPRAGPARAQGPGTAPSTLRPQQSGLLQHLIEAWDGVRKLNEPKAVPARPTAVQSTAEVDSRFLAVTLEHNRFCFCKGSSHVSNHVYLVVDRERGTFHQKCHDVDCRSFCSPPFQIPSWLLEDDDDDSKLFESPPTKKRPLDEVTPQDAQKHARVEDSRYRVEPPPFTAAPLKSATKACPVPAQQAVLAQRAGICAGGKLNASQGGETATSDEELIGADPDEVAVAQGEGLNASQESTDWFDVDKLW